MIKASAILFICAASAFAERGAERLIQSAPLAQGAAALFPPSLIAAPPIEAYSVTVTWRPSPDTNVIGYNVYYGAASRSYTNKTDCGSATNLTISGLVSGPTYYFAATAYDTLGIESNYSAEVSYPPAPLTNVVVSACAESSTSVQGPWTPVPNSTFFTATNPVGKKFWRLKISENHF